MYVENVRATREKRHTILFGIPTHTHTHTSVPQPL